MKASNSLVSNKTTVSIEGNGTIIEIQKTTNSTNFETQRQICLQKGGDLVELNNMDRQNLVVKVLKDHLQTFGLSKASYLIGNKVNDVDTLVVCL